MGNKKLAPKIEVKVSIPRLCESISVSDKLLHANLGSLVLVLR